ncbi:HLA class II histocompatibility antigen gamma chain-like isoform X2 [Pristis pectinata]|uniref:HLA class II histocompatibility antigen gamma chain-like isoform X2 n=1 Tax=Pristis pectinata TaxID=685728 RepID=UPI00223CE80F|nr:HLA class II histocompatibility antigen gamma chain-like isoform X2 [Pristis pectinata]
MSVDEQQNALLRNSQQDIASHSDVEVRAVTPTAVPGQRSNSWSRGLLYTGVSILVAMLIAGQVVSVMFLLKQQDKITNLQKTTSRIESKYSSPSSGRPKPVMHLRPMMMDLPMAYINPEAEAPKAPATTAQPLTLPEQVQQLLKEGNKTVNIPELKGSFSDNLELLKQSLKESDWEDFESWLQNWLLFQLVQNEKKTVPTSAPKFQPRRDPQPSERKIFSSMAMRPMLHALPLSADEPKKSEMPKLVPVTRGFLNPDDPNISGLGTI